MTIIFIMGAVVGFALAILCLLIQSMIKEIKDNPKDINCDDIHDKLERMSGE